MLKFKKYAPLANRILIRRNEPMTKTAGGILIPEAHQTEVSYGEVVATGPGLTFSNGTLRKMEVKVGQTVLLPTYGGTKLTLADSQDYWVYRDDDIMGVLEEPVNSAASAKK